jgi:hypothetical protein
VDTLLGLIDDVLPFDMMVRARFRLSVGDGANIHLLHEFGRVMRTDCEDDHFIIEAEVSQSLKDRLSQYCMR